MKKTLWMLGVAVAALTSCAQSEVLEVPESKLIAFETHVDKPTRTTNDITDGNTTFKEFYIYCAKGTKSTSTETLNHFINEDNQNYYLDGVKVTGGKGAWTYNHRPWLSDRTFRFAAYANGNADGDTDNDAQLQNVAFKIGTTAENKDWGLTISNYEVGEKDLIIAIPGEKVITDITSTPPSVGLTFKHVLAKVLFQFRYSGAENLTLEIEPFLFEAAGTGTCTAVYTGDETNSTIGASWTNNTYGESNKKEYTLFPLVDSANQSWETGNVQDAVYVIPQSNTGLEIDKITIHTKDDDNNTLSSKVFENVSLAFSQHPTWKPGYVYRYIADISPELHYIHFTTSVNSWVDDDDRNQVIASGSN